MTIYNYHRRQNLKKIDKIKMATAASYGGEVEPHEGIRDRFITYSRFSSLHLAFYKYRLAKYF
jgi:hypothetical protein